MITEAIMNKAHELEEKRTIKDAFLSGCLEGLVDSCFVIGASICVIGGLTIIGNKMNS